MTENLSGIRSGYALERLFANELSFTGHPLQREMPDAEAPIRIGWDWSVDGPGRFSVRLMFQVLPTQARPETVAVSLSAGFTRRGEPTVPVLDFVSKHAPALMMPYVREAVSSLTSRGLNGALLLPPYNVLSMMSNIDANEAEGMRQIREDASLAESLGIPPLV